MTIKTTVFILTIDDPVLHLCEHAIQEQTCNNFKLDYIRNIRPFNAAMQEAINRCDTEYFIQVDEDMILYPDAVKIMQDIMDRAPDDVGMLCFHLYDEDRAQNIQGIKIYRLSCFKKLIANDVLTSEMDLLEQLDRTGVKWVLCPQVMGRHGVIYSPESIYLRYKSMYQKDIKAWNTVTLDIRRKADTFRQTGDILQLFALLGAAHGIIEAPRAEDKETKDYERYNLKELELYKKLFLENSPDPFLYEENTVVEKQFCQPCPYEKVQWKSGGPHLGEKHVKILIACTHFWPCVGGVESIVADLGSHLIRSDYEVFVATLPYPGRNTNTYRGINIITLLTGMTTDGKAIWPLHLKNIIESGEYAACILISNPLTPLIWAAENAQIPINTRVIIQPVINADDYSEWEHNTQFKECLSRLLKRNTTVTLTQKGLDRHFCDQEGVTAYYLPNAVDGMPVSGGFREKYQLPNDIFVILHVANMYKVKNHLGLINALNNLPKGFKLVMVGHPVGEQDYVESVLQQLTMNQQILYIPGLSPDAVREAIHAADLVVLSSHGEVSPVSILEAMSLRKPWLATPACGTVNEIAGGIVAPLDQFAAIISALNNCPERRAELGMLGYLHWKSCFVWYQVIEGWEELITSGDLTRSFEMPEHIGQRMSLVRDRILQQVSLDQERATLHEPVLQSGVYDSDKGQHYLQRYEQFLHDLVDRDVCLLELGVFKGGSLQLWRDYFTRGLIIGLDVNRVDVDDSTGRIRVYQGFQQDLGLLDKIRSESAPKGFDVIIDDASHMGNLTKASFLHLFEKHLKPGGIYVIEDWGTGYWADWPDGSSYVQGVSHQSGMVGFVKELIDACGASDISRSATLDERPISMSVASVHVFPGLVFVIKAAI